MKYKKDRDGNTEKETGGGTRHTEGQTERKLEKEREKHGEGKNKGD